MSLFILKSNNESTQVDRKYPSVYHGCMSDNYMVFTTNINTMEISTISNLVTLDSYTGYERNKKTLYKIILMVNNKTTLGVQVTTPRTVNSE